MFSELSVYHGVCLLEEDEKRPQSRQIKTSFTFFFSLTLVHCSIITFSINRRKKCKTGLSDFLSLLQGNLKTG